MTTRTRGRRRILVVGLVLVVIIAAGWFGLPYLNRARESGAFPMCPRNLRELGQAMTLYAEAHGGALPSTLEDLLRVDDFELSPVVFVCPSSSDVEVDGLHNTPSLTAQQIIDRMRERGLPASLEDPPRIPPQKPRYCSYIYIGRGMTKAQLTPQTVLAYEPLSNHDGDGANVLFGDGHVEFIDRESARKLIASLPHPPATTSTTATAATTRSPDGR